MNKTYIGTKLATADYRAFRIKAAESGMSASALLRKLAMAELSKARKKAKP